MVLDLVNKFGSAEMRSYRRSFAATLLEGRKIDLRNDAPVLEFFEEIGYMTRRKVLDEGMVWNSFSWWIEPYYLVSREAIVEARSETQSPSYFIEIEWLYDQMVRVGAKRQESVHIPRSSEFCRWFLEQERDLATARP